jgi:CHAT domain-containing protein/tetratricopeptide (TPR) repeat protein
MLLRRRPAMARAVTARLRAGADRDDGARLALGLLAQDRGDPEAEALLRRAAAGLRARHDATGEADAWRALVPVLVSQRRVEDADEALAAATRLAEASGDDELKTGVRVAEARLALGRSAYDRAWAVLKDVEPALFPRGPAVVQGDALGVMGSTLTAMGRHREAAGRFQRQLDLARALGDRHQEAAALTNLAIATSRAAQVISPEVVALLDRALEAALESGNAPVEAAIRLALSQDLTRPLPPRVAQIERALVVLRRMKDLRQTCFALRELARWLADERMGQTDRAFRVADEAIALARQSGDPFDLARGLFRRWNLASSHWPRERAVAAGLETLDAIERLRDIQGDADARARVASEWAFVYQQLLGFLVSPVEGAPTEDDLDRAFGVAERLRAQELLGALDAAGSAEALAERRPEHAVRQAVLQEIVRAQRRLLDPGLGDDDRRRLLADLERLEVRERSLNERLRMMDPVGGRKEPGRSALIEVREALAPDQAVLSFVVCQRKNNRMRVECPWVFVVTRDAARAVRLPEAASDPDLAVAGLAGLVGRRDGTEAAGAARLYEVLLKEALSSLPASVRRLVIVPDAALHRVPFDALRADPRSAPLLERYEVSVVPSASLWVRLRHAPASSSGALLALADPQWGGPSAASIERQAVLWNGLSLGRLPRGRTEARRALRSVAGAGRLVTGDQATERFLKTADLKPYAVLHLAAHAVVDDENPERSAIVLAPGESEEDGLLQSREIVGLNLTGLVVVLSACRSSGGEVLRGEGALSLARAFLQAGARAVVGNLWEVRDDEAEELMVAFYRHLGQGRSVGAALASARRERARAGAPTAAWAGTVVLGDGDAVLPAPVRGSGGAEPLVGLAAALLATAFLALLYRSARAARPAA